MQEVQICQHSTQDSEKDVTTGQPALHISNMLQRKTVPRDSDIYVKKS